MADEQPQTMTAAEWYALGEKLFGSEVNWRFTCPHCSNVMSLEKARALPAEQLARLRSGKWSIESECIGRYVAAGCNWAAYGLFSGPFFVTRPNGKRTPVFGFDISGS